VQGGGVELVTFPQNIGGSWRIILWGDLLAYNWLITGL
jgi:hypothetical protein